MAAYLSEKSGKNICFEILKKEFHEKWVAIMPRRSSELKEFPIEDYLQPFLDKHKISLSKNECIESIDIQCSEYRKYLWIENGLADLLKLLKSNGLKIGVISNSCVYDEINYNHFRSTELFPLIDTFVF